jgi:hypothetical protein
MVGVDPDVEAVGEDLLGAGGRGKQLAAGQYQQQEEAAGGGGAACQLLQLS